MAGLVSLLAGLTGLVYMAVYWVVRMAAMPELTPLHQRPIVLYSVAGLLLGAQLLSMGFLAELLIEKDQPKGRRFSVSQTTSKSGNDRSRAASPIAHDDSRLNE